MRKLRFEALERRDLLAGDACAIPDSYDVNDSGDIGPADVLEIVNGLNAEIQESRLDADCSGRVAPLDALVVINHVNAYGAGTPAWFPVKDFADVPSYAQAGTRAALGGLEYAAFPGKSVTATVVLTFELADQGEIRWDAVGIGDVSLTDSATGVVWPAQQAELSGGTVTFAFFPRLTGEGILEISAELDIGLAGDQLRMTATRINWITRPAAPLLFSSESPWVFLTGIA